MDTSLKKSSRPTSFITIGISSLLVAAVVTAGFVDSGTDSSSTVTTGPVELTNGQDDSYTESIASGFIAEHISVSSGIDSSEFSEYSTDLAQTLTKLTPDQRNDVFRGVAAYEEDIFASE